MTTKRKTKYIVEAAIGWGESVMIGPFDTEDEAIRYVYKRGSGTVHDLMYPLKDEENNDT